VKTLWTFDTQAKLEDFAAVLRQHDIAHEIASKSDPRKPNNEVTISVDEAEFEYSKKLLLKHRKRRTSRDSSNITPPKDRMQGGH
jgi:hypothetical protein